MNLTRAACPLLGHGHGLHVVTAQVGLQVQDGQVVVLLQRQQLAQRRISLDRLLLHQAVRLGVAHHGLGHIRATHLRTLGLGQEGAQLVRDLGRHREEARLLDLALHCRRLATAAALSLLHQTAGLGTQGLQARQSQLQSGLQAVQLLLQSLDALQQHGALRGRLSRLCSRLGCSSGCSHRGLRSLGLGGLGSLGSLGGCRSSCLNNCCNGGSLRGRLGCGLGGTHDTSTGGSIGRHGTRMITGEVQGNLVNFGFE